MKKTLFILSLFSSLLLFSQRIINGNPFEFTIKTEKDVKFAWVDESSSYLSSTIHNDLPNFRKFIVKKFDSNNKLEKEMIHDYPLVDDKAMYTYLGSFTNSKNIVYLSSTYSAKAKKYDLYKTVFDKNSESFTSSLLASYPIESLMKSGSISYAVSDNGRYAGVVYYAHAGRKDPKNVYLTILDTNSTDVAWKKDLVLNEDTASRYFAVSNNGKAFLTRDPSSWKGASTITTVAKDGQDKILLEGDMLIYQPYIFTKGSDDYLIAYNSTKKTTKDTYEQIMIYDLTNGKILSNTPSTGYSNYKQPEDVEIRKVFFQNGQFHVFTEGKKSAGTVNKPTPMGTMTFPETIFIYTAGQILAFDENGVFKTGTNIGSQSQSDNENFHSYGISNVMGNYMISSEGWTLIDQVNPSTFKKERHYINLDDAENVGGLSINYLIPHVTSYDAKSKTYFMLQSDRNTSGSIVKVTGYALPQLKK